MPLVLAQNMKAMSTINAQPNKMSSKIHLLVMMDIAGATGNQMSEHSGLTPARVSLIRTSPLFTEERNRKMNELQDKIIDKKSSSIAEGDPVEMKLKSLALEAVGTYEHILRSGRSESVQKVTADSILDRAGYKSHTEKMKVSIEVTEKMASRFEEVLGYNANREATSSASALMQNNSVGPQRGLHGCSDECLHLKENKSGESSQNDRETTVSVKAEMSE